MKSSARMEVRLSALFLWRSALLLHLLDLGEGQFQEPLSRIRLARPMPAQIDCSSPTFSFHCLSNSNLCIRPESVRDGIADCPDASDEDVGHINICDYAVHYSDYRCSRFANCLDYRHSGYACQCKVGYIGPGDTCQPAPLNLPAVLHSSPSPLIIRTLKHDNDHNLQSGRPDLATLSHQILDRVQNLHPFNNFEQAPTAEGGVREQRQEASPDTPQTTLQVTPPKATMVCPAGTVMIKEGAQVWCLKLNHGRIEFPQGVFTSDEARRAAAQASSTLAQASAAANQLNITSLHQQPDHSINASQGYNNALDMWENPDTAVGFHGYTDNGALYGYLPTSSPVQQQPLVLTDASDVSVPDGSIITPVKVWNASGNAFTAYRIMPNVSLPPSCLRNPTSAKFMCADGRACLSAERVLDGGEDCADGSDEVPEFIDECALAGAWPQYRCGQHALCTDSMKGYSCACFATYYWDQSGCVSSALLTSAASAAQTTYVSLESHPGYAFWKAGNNASNILSSGVIRAANGSDVAVSTSPYRRPVTQCDNCNNPLSVTMGPHPPLEQGRQDGRQSNLFGYRPAQFSFTGNAGSRLSPFVVGDTRADTGRTTMVPAGVTITGTYYPPEVTTRRTDQGLGYTLAGMASPVAQQGSSALAASRANLTVLSVPSSASGYVGPVPSSAQGQPALANQESQLMQPGSAATSDQWSAVLDALRRGSSGAASSTSRPPSTASSAVTYVTNAAGQILNISTAGTLFGRLPPTTSSNAFLQTAASTLSQPKQPQASPNNAASINYAVLGNAASGYGASFGGAVATTVLPFRQTSSPLAVATTRFSTQIPQILLGGFGGLPPFGNTGPAFFASSTRPPLASGNSFSTSATLSTLLLAVNTAPSLSSAGDNRRPGDTLTDLGAAVAAGAVGAALVSNSFAGAASTRVPPNLNNATSTLTRPYVGAAARSDTDSGQLNTTLSPVTIVLGNTTVVVSSPPPPLPAVEPLLPNGLINPAAYPTDRLWSPIRFRPGTAPLLQSLPPLLDNATSPEDLAMPLEQVYDCFGDLFRTAYSSLSNRTKACSQGCRDDLNEVCVRPAGRCDCREGTTRNSLSGRCELSFQYNVAMTMDQLCNQTLQFRPYLADLNNPSTQQFSVIVCYQMEEMIRQSAIADRYGGGSCHPLAFSAGSVVSSVALSFISSNTSQAALPFDLIRALADVLVRNQGLLAPTSFPSPALRVKAENANNTSNTYLVNVRDISECDLDAPICDVNADCRNSFGSFACVCRPGFVDENPVFPGRVCGFPSQTTLLANGTILGCPSNYYQFATLCLHPAYYILLIIAFVILGLLVLAILICLFAWCYRCCNDTESEYNAPQAALIRAAARSPRLSTTEAVTSQYQVLRSTEGRSSLEAPQPSAPYLGPSANLDVERARSSSSKSPLQDNLLQTTQVQTWEEVEVPTTTTKEDDNVSRRVLSPSVQSLREKSAQLEKHLEEERLAEVVTTQQPVEEVKAAEGIVAVLPTDGTSIGSAHDIARTDYTFPTSPSTSMKAVSSAIHAAKRLRTEAREGIRKASSETRDWDAMPRTDSLDVTDNQLDINTLPHNGYDKDPIFTVTAGSSGAVLAEDRSSRMGLNARDSLDDMMEQTGQFYPHSSSDQEYEKEDDLSKTRALPTSDLVISTNDGQRRDSQVERQPAFVLVGPGASLDEATATDLSQDDDDHHSLRSTDEDELKRLNGSTQSLNSVKEAKRRSHDSVIDHMVEEQAAFYTNTDLEEEEEDKADNAQASQPHMLMLPTEEQERLPSAVQRDIAREFGAMGERDSIDDMLDHTSAFFSRASTLDSFQLPKSDSGGDIADSSTASRKGSQNLSGEGSDGSALRLLPNSGLRKPLLKKRSAFYSRDSMNRIVENTSEVSVNPEDGTTTVQKTELKDDIVEGGSLEHESPAPSQRSLSEATLQRQAERFDLDDDDINEFFTETGSKERPASASQVEEAVLLREEYLEETVLVHRTLSADSVRERDRDNQSLLDFERLEESVSQRQVDEAADFAIPEESASPLRQAETSSVKRDSLEEQAEVTRLQDLERPPSNISLSSPPNAKEMVILDETVTERRASLPDQDLPPSPTAKEDTLARNDPDNKSIKSVSDHNILNSLRDKNASPQLILHDTDSGVYVDTGQTDREGSAPNRRRRPMSSQDDLRIFEGQEERRQGSGSSYQRQAHSDEEEEEGGVMKPYSTTSEVGGTARPHHKRLRNNYDMTAPESRHVYYSSRPKRMPPRQEESDIWANSTWWRLRK